MNILFTICGRAGSKGVINKNLRLFLGYPLVYYTLAAVELYTRKYGKEDAIHFCLSTDSKELVDMVNRYTREVFVVNRDAALCGDSVAKVDVIRDCLARSEVYFSVVYDIVVDLDITSPLRTVEDIKTAVDKLVSNIKFDIIFSVTPARRNPYFNMVKLEPDGSCSKVIASDYIARQQAPLIFDMNASIYVYRLSYLRKDCAACYGFIEMTDTAVLDIDSEEDLGLMQHIAEYIYCKYPDYAEIHKSVISKPGIEVYSG